MRADPDFYATLQLSPGSSLEDIKRQYRRLAKIYHPDRNNNAEWCQEQSKRLNLAYEYLLDPARKAAYDARFRPVMAASNPPPARPYRQPPPEPPFPGRAARTAPGMDRSFESGSLSFLRWALFGKYGPPVLLTLGVGIVLWLSWSSGISDNMGGAASHVTAAGSRQSQIGDDGMPAPISPAPIMAPGAQVSADDSVIAGADPRLSDIRDPNASPDLTAPAGDAASTASLDPGVPSPLPARFQNIISAVNALIAAGDSALLANSNPLSPVQGRLERDLNILRTRRGRALADLDALENSDITQNGQSRAKMLQASQGDFDSLEAASTPAKAALWSLKAAQGVRSTLSAPPKAEFTPMPPVKPPASEVPAQSARRPAPVPRPALARRPAPRTPANPHLSTSGPDEAQFSIPDSPGYNSSP